ncbi:hypothetical protein HPB50_008578 [Hyalomma asiaticum]|uniref:Uncharacterized protein n=1 Tax=Hyalomma asiaticum TaxID=266040 RepID=A0ACB7SWM5_HYAAI|nr:hypothetical protein HPB50_008578 [Hyalomma asiaticum]
MSRVLTVMATGRCRPPPSTSPSANSTFLSHNRNCLTACSLGCRQLLDPAATFLLFRGLSRVRTAWYYDMEGLRVSSPKQGTSSLGRPLSRILRRLVIICNSVTRPRRREKLVREKYASPSRRPLLTARYYPVLAFNWSRCYEVLNVRPAARADVDVVPGATTVPAERRDNRKSRPPIAEATMQAAAIGARATCERTPWPQHGRVSSAESGRGGNVSVLSLFYRCRAMQVHANAADGAAHGGSVHQRLLERKGRAGARGTAGRQASECVRAHSLGRVFCGAVDFSRTSPNYDISETNALALVTSPPSV